MKASDQLFQLIKSLGKQEKRYFNVFASTHREGSAYTLLFDHINKQKTYNEKAIKEHFKSHSFVKQYAVTKFMLYQLILKSMNGVTQ